MTVGRPRKYFTEEERKAANVIRAIKWRQDNKERYEKNEKARRVKSADKINAARKKWAKNNKEKLKKSRCKRAHIRRKEDPIYRFKNITRSLIYGSFARKQKYKKHRTEKILGCSIESFRNYILSKCPEGVTIKDFGKYGYHLDHIIPISSANTEEEVIKLCHYTNFQPLFWKDNIIKSNKIL